MPHTSRSEIDFAARVSPLATLVRGLIERVLPIDALDDLFDEVIGDRRLRTLTTGTITHLMLQVVSGTRRAVFAAFQADQAEDQPLIGTTYQALYQRLGRIFPDYSCALVRFSARRLGPLLGRGRPRDFAAWRGYRLRIVDGTMPDGSEHRLKVLRKLGPAGLPAKIVFVFDPVRHLCVDAQASEDAYASDASLAEILWTRARRGDLYVADRAYCSSSLFVLLIQRRSAFVIRELTGLAITESGPLQDVGELDGGRVLEQPVVVHSPKTGRSLHLRRIVFRLAQPTQKGEEEVLLLTNLQNTAGAVAITDLYGRRWDIESQINQLKHVLSGEIRTLGQPRAAIFVLCLAMVASNVIAVARALIRREHAEVKHEDELSGYYLADEIAGNDRAVTRLVSIDAWRLLGALSTPEFREWCGRIVRQIRPAAFRKHPRGPNRPPPKRSSGKHRHHFSTYRLLNEEKKDR